MNYCQPAIVAFRSNYLPAYKAAVIYVPIRHLYICREPSTNQLIFMQNKPNFQDNQMNVSVYLQTAYENKHNWTLSENKPNSKPIQTQSNLVLSAVEWANLPDAQMSVNSILRNDYERNDIFTVPENKANSNPISKQLQGRLG